MVATILVRRISARYRSSRSSASDRRPNARRHFDASVAYHRHTVPIPSRPLPRVGVRARIVHFGGAVEYGVVAAVQDDGRRLRVRDEAGQVLDYALNPATARFVLAGDARGPRLELLGEPELPL